MYLQLRPGGVLLLEAQDFKSYSRKRKLTVSLNVLLWQSNMYHLYMCVSYYGLYYILCIINVWSWTVSRYSVSLQGRPLQGDVYVVLLFCFFSLRFAETTRTLVSFPISSAATFSRRRWGLHVMWSSGFQRPRHKVTHLRVPYLF